MNHLSLDDSTSDLNLKINESLVLMDSTENSNSQIKKKDGKSINLNLEVQTPTSVLRSLGDNETPNGILEKLDNNVLHETGQVSSENIQQDNLIVEPRPHNLEELVKADGLLPITIESTFSLDDLSDSDEIWLMEIPKSVNPESLNGQDLSLTDKSKLKVGEDRYIASHRDVKGNLTCVFSTEKGSTSLKTVNIKPAGIIQIRQKLTAIPRTNLEYTERTKVPLPQNVRHRDPFFGVVSNVTNIKVEEQSCENR